LECCGSKVLNYFYPVSSTFHLVSSNGAPWGMYFNDLGVGMIRVYFDL
jgi:hypothetical protein